MLSRNVEKIIKNWLLNKKEALLVTGARQIGKTFTIRECLKTTSTDYLEINLIERPELIPVFDNISNTDDMILRLSAVSNKKLIPGKTVIFIDEVQELKEIVTRIKFLVEDGRFRYILSGSLLGVELKDIKSVPVGYMDVIDMYPLNIREFYTNLGLSEDILSHIKMCYEEEKPVDNYIHDKLIKTFYLYLIVGGMPEAVNSYLETNDLAVVNSVHRKIMRLYKADFTKYEKKNNLKLKEIYDAIPGELSNQNKRFFINNIKGESTYEKMADDFIWLKDAGVALPVYNVTEPTAPLIISEKRNLFKLFMSDVGLLCSLYTNDVRLKILANDVNVNNGALFENVVAQELVSHGYKLYYFNSKKQGELDFVVEHEGNILPLEIKSGKNYKRHNALENVLANDDYGIKKAFVLCNDNVKVDGKKKYLPIYMMLFIEETNPDSMKYSMDLKTLSLKKNE